MISTISKNVLVRFTLLQFFLYAYMGAFTPYMIALGLDRGLSQTMVSIAVSFQMICVLMGNVSWGRISDRQQTGRLPFIAALSLCGVFQILLFFSRNMSLFFLIYGLFGLFSGAVGVLLDSWFMRAATDEIAVYRKVRSAGAVGYAFAIAGSGKIVETNGFGYAIALSTVMIFITIALCFTGREEAGDHLLSVQKSESPTLTRNRQKTGASFLRQPLFLVWIMLILLTGLATSPVGNLKVVILERLEAGTAELGLDGFIGCAAQFAMFFLVGKLEKHSPVKRMLIVSLCVMVGLALYINAGSVVMVYAASILFYAIFSIINPCTREIVKSVVPAEDQTTAIGIADAFSNNVSTMIAMLYSGAVSDRYGINTLLSICMTFSVITIFICFGLLLHRAAPKPRRSRRKLAH